VQPHYIKAPN